MIYSKQKDYKRPLPRKKNRYQIGDIIFIKNFYGLVRIRDFGFNNFIVYDVHDYRYISFHINRKDIIGKIRSTNKLYRLINV